MNGAYLHLLINHVPVIGTVFGILSLCFAMLRKSDELKRASLGLFVLVALSAIPAYLTGEPAEKVAEQLPGVTEALIEQHESAALIALSAAIATGVVALAGLFLAFRKKLIPVWLSLALLILALATGGFMARAANFGGQIRHTEIRAGASAQAGAQGSTETKEEKHREKKDD